MPTQEQVFCYFWIKVIDEAAQIRDDAEQLARAASTSSSRLEPGNPVVVNPVTNDRPGGPVVVNPVTNDRPGGPVVVNPVTNDRPGGPLVVNPVTNDRSGGAVTQWTQSTAGSTSITISTVPQGYVVADASAQYATGCIALNQSFDEESARQWIDTDDGKRWRGNAKVCVLHHVVVTLAS